MTSTPTVWNEIFKDKGLVFTTPHEKMPALAQLLQARAAQRVLDLGCGSGRHVLYFAQQGFTVYGLDSAPEGIRLTQQALASQNLSAELTLQDIYEPLPYATASIDAIISTQVIHHATIVRIRGLIQELWRVLRFQGVLYITVAMQKNQGTRFQEIEPNTYIPLDGREAGLPHYYFTPQTLGREFAAFDVQDIHLDATNHLCLLAVKKMPEA